MSSPKYAVGQVVKQAWNRVKVVRVEQKPRGNRYLVQRLDADPGTGSTGYPFMADEWQLEPIADSPAE